MLVELLLLEELILRQMVVKLSQVLATLIFLVPVMLH